MGKYLATLDIFVVVSSTGQDEHGWSRMSSVLSPIFQFIYAATAQSRASYAGNEHRSEALLRDRKAAGR